MARNAHLETKLKLQEALLTCLESTAYERITVSQITDAAHVSRKTFYYHFDDKNDLVKWICMNGMNESTNKITSDGPTAYIELIRFFISQNRILYGNALQDMSLGSFGQLFSDVLFYQISGRLKNFYLDQFQSRSVANLAISQDVEAGRNLAIIWLLHPAEPTADDLLRYIYLTESVRTKTVSRWLAKKGTLDTFSKAPLFEPTPDVFKTEMIHQYSVRESFEMALDNQHQQRIATERYPIEVMRQQFR